MNFLVVLVFSAFILGTYSGDSGHSVQQLPSCYRVPDVEDLWETGKDGYEYRIMAHPNEKNWSDAQAHCLTLGANLAMEKTSKINQYLKGWLSETGMNIWVGVEQTDIANEVLHYVDGTQVPRSKKYWQSGADKSHACIEYEDQGGRWNSMDCNTPLAYICQRMMDNGCSDCNSKIVMAHYIGLAFSGPLCESGDDTDSYEAAQCEAKTMGSVCWCVFENGEPIPDTNTTLTTSYGRFNGQCRIKRIEYDSPCKTKQKEAIIADAQYAPACQDNGYFKVRQCIDGNLCWCSMPDGTVVPNTLHSDSDKTEAYCWNFRVYEETCAGGDGIIAHTFDNKRFIMCGGGGVFSCRCPEELVYNNTLGLCEEK